MAIAWRIVKKKYAASAFDGEGARQNGGRWTRAGRSVVYTAGSISLATLEILVHLGFKNATLLESYSLFQVDVPDNLVLETDAGSLPPWWSESPARNELCLVGDAWLDERKKPVLRVPSAIVPYESNYLLNPEHPDFARISIGREQAYVVDPRLYRAPPERNGKTAP